MKLEKRYYVAKLSDLKELTPEDLKTFNEICTKIEIGRGINGKKPIASLKRCWTTKNASDTFSSWKLTRGLF